MQRLLELYKVIKNVNGLLFHLLLLDVAATVVAFVVYVGVGVGVGAGVGISVVGSNGRCVVAWFVVGGAGAF